MFRLTTLALSSLLLAACASGPQRPEGLIDILTTARGQALAGAECTVQTDRGSWTLQTPAAVNVGEPSGDLWVVCNREGYRTSEVIVRAPGSDCPREVDRISIWPGGRCGWLAQAASSRLKKTRAVHRM